MDRAGVSAGVRVVRSSSGWAVKATARDSNGEIFAKVKESILEYEIMSISNPGIKPKSLHAFIDPSSQDALC